MIDICYRCGGPDRFVRSCPAISAFFLAGGIVANFEHNADLDRLVSTSAFSNSEKNTMSDFQSLTQHQENEPESHVIKFERVLVDKKRIVMPDSVSPHQKNIELESQTSVVVIGPNGAGKSRLGAWLEMTGPQKESVHRITAQRSLIFPESVSPIGMEIALRQFHWAAVPANWDMPTYELNKTALKHQKRYGGNLSSAITAPLNDINDLITLLFSENYTALLEREEIERQGGQLVKAKETLLRRVQGIWESLLPHRKLLIKSGDIQAKVTNAPEDQESYPAKAMSDGERVVFYLIGQCLCAKENAIILIDEPEIHLHKAIQDSLWNALEAARPDCLFVYLTHDLTFAADRKGAVKVCLKSYTAAGFNWFEVKPQVGIPEDVYLEVLGSRKPVLFVEGDSGSPDYEIYQLVFPEYTIKPVGSCASVIEATKVFRDQKELHNLQCFGLIDRDYLTVDQIDAYARKGVYTLKVAEVENLYLVPELLICMAEQLLVDADLAVTAVMDLIFRQFTKDLKIHAKNVMNQQVLLHLGRFSSSKEEVDDYAADLKNHLESVDASEIYQTALAEAQTLIDSKDYVGILAVYNRKDIVTKIAHIFETRNGTYVEKVRELYKRRADDFPRIFAAYLPKLHLDA